MLFSGMAANAVVAAASEAGALASGARWKKTREPITRPIAARSKATISVVLGERGALVCRSAGACFHPFLCLNFSGTSGLPRASL